MIRQILANHFDETFSVRSLSGGDINAAYQAESENYNFCIKVNSASQFPRMFEKEADGLQLLEESNSLMVPKVHFVGEQGGEQYLIMDFVEGGLRSAKMWESFGRGLAELHQSSSNQFGLGQSNFIGSLVQQNEPQDSWEEFLLTQRFEPMLKMAVNGGHISTAELARFSRFESQVKDIWPTEPAALLHGDLWSGNFLPASNDRACIIDPAVYYGHREMDIAMMQLFGGFSNQLFEAYDEVFPLELGWQERIPYNQLYPLLVHVNLFGRSYWSGIQRIISAF